ncbi:hypothetical protein DFH06DRAFT_526482 [Mycena polygramma]|nr:hypothetical protein DFH06DRAFT_526482 [Mycena polygramma]
MAEVPQELIDKIIEQVPENSLAACSLTATPFLVSSQRRLFRWMSLRDLPMYERTGRLLATSPHLGKYVRFLALCIHQLPVDYAVLKGILPLMPEIERLSIEGFSLSETNDIARNPCLVDLLLRPTIRSLGLANLMNVPASLILRAFSSFEEVLFSNVYLAEVQASDREGTGASYSPGTVWHLGIHGEEMPEGEDEYSLLFFLLHPARIGILQNLRRLSVVIPPIPQRALDGFTSLLVACSPTLEYLALELEEPPAYLPDLPVLKELELWLDVELTKTPAMLLSILTDAVATVPNLEVLTLAILDRPAGPHRPHRQMWTGRRPWIWADLDDLWADSDRPALREVHFSLRWFHLEPSRYAEFVPFIEAHLPRTFNAGLIKFSYRFSFTHQMDKFVAETTPLLLSRSS